MLEALILAVCVQGSSEACDRSLRAYYQTPTPITQTARKWQEQATDAYERHQALQYVGPVVAILIQQEAAVKIYDKTFITFNRESFIIIYEIPL